MSCAQAVRTDGAALVLQHDHSRSFVVGVAGRLSRQIADLQFTMGQGPTFDVQGGATVLVPDVTCERSAHRWPLFAPAAAELGIRALFALPLVAEDITIGALQLYRTRPAPLSPVELVEAMTYAQAAAELLVQHDRSGDQPQHWIVDTGLGGRAEIYQAAGWLAAKRGISVDDALIRLKAYAYCRDQPIAQLALAVLADDPLTHDLVKDPP
ncbi:MAG: GAF and ANTAR domain-containing protein [Actinopolymorphaceae bacterium]